MMRKSIYAKRYSIISSAEDIVREFSESELISVFFCSGFTDSQLRKLCDGYIDRIALLSIGRSKERFRKDIVENFLYLKRNLAERYDDVENMKSFLYHIEYIGRDINSIIPDI